MATRILVSGGTGSVGVLLCDYLTSKGYEVSILSRTRRAGSKYTTFLWDYKDQFIEEQAFDNCDYIVHLAGAGIADKAWTNERKKEIIDSRVETTKLIYRSLAKRKHQIKAIVSASAVGFYGQQTSPVIFKEQDAPGNDFVAQVCKQWEEETRPFENLGIRTVNLRIGIVLMQKGGALEKMVQPFKMNIGSALGTGKQFIPWIHGKDLIRIISKALEENSMSNAYNCAAPDPVDNIGFSRAIAKKLGKSMWLPKVPVFVLKLILGERSILLTEGSRVSSDKILQTEFKFEFPDLESALDDLLQ
ncbi:TIGR01777 family oxidoreductase [Lutimonas sp.]|uniref:TIGR01777 family oxidoreductase n=1 Tax=Lutimonas sp. TaxID=1872403 RepID=UPI003D9AE6F4